MQQFNLTHATCLDVKEEHYCLPVGKRIYYRWVHDKDQVMIDFLHPKNTHWVQTIIAGSLFRAMRASGPPSNVDVHQQNAANFFNQEYPSIQSEVYNMPKSMEDAAREEQRRYANMLKYHYYETPAEQIPVISPGFYITLQEITSTPCRGTGYLTLPANRKIHVARIDQPWVNSKRWSVIVDINSYEFSFDYMTFAHSARAECQDDFLKTVDNFTARQREVEIKQKEAEVKEKMAVVDRLTAARTKLVNAAANLGMVTRGETKRVRITNESAKRYEGRNGTVALSSMKNPQMGPGYKQLEVGYDDPTGDDFLVGVN